MLVDAKLDVGAELDAMEWCGGRPRTSAVAAAGRWIVTVVGGAGRGTGEGVRRELREQMGRSRLEGRTP